VQVFVDLLICQRSLSIVDLQFNQWDEKKYREYLTDYFVSYSI
jgi:hypothetical protein